MKQIPNRTPEEVAGILDSMTPYKATRYYNKCMTNPNTPEAIVQGLLAYRGSNPSKFLSEDQMRNARSGSWTYGKGFSGGYRNRQGRVFDGDGFSYDAYGNRYDGYGRNTDSYSDGGREPFQGYGSPNGFSDWYGAANVRYKPKKKQRPISEARSVAELENTVKNLKSNVARTRYFMKVQSNPETNPETMQNLAIVRNTMPEMFVSDEEAVAAGPTMQRKGFWSNLWKPKDDFEAMSPKEKKFFVGAFRRKNRANNTSYSLRVLTNPNTSQEDKDAMVNVVRNNPLLFFSKAQPQMPQGNDGRIGAAAPIPAPKAPAATKKPAAKKAARKS